MDAHQGRATALNRRVGPMQTPGLCHQNSRLEAGRAESAHRPRGGGTGGRGLRVTPKPVFNTPHQKAEGRKMPLRTGVPSHKTTGLDKRLDKAQDKCRPEQQARFPFPSQETLFQRCHNVYQVPNFHKTSTFCASSG
ncbi:hypothetical protein AV530_006670 [Patagioenas fasciata monilis]|uniref:Uncharacterized protein n=1 Tax=Patagioenas fasciata monilis TaxID=372326 RepID=A0A1V4KPX4_PATFA|nr:hypothetical protein AV530_006670 [Patagioenas fasciata monilis]